MKSSRGVRKVNPKRRAKNWPREFGGAERVAWIQGQACVVMILCRWDVPRHNHHVKSRGAGGRYQDIVPLCESHHRQLHAIGRKSFERAHDINLERAAAETEARWQEHLRSRVMPEITDEQWAEHSESA